MNIYLKGMNDRLNNKQTFMQSTLSKYICGSTSPLIQSENCCSLPLSGIMQSNQQTPSTPLPPPLLTTPTPHAAVGCWQDYSHSPWILQSSWHHFAPAPPSTGACRWISGCCKMFKQTGVGMRVCVRSLACVRVWSTTLWSFWCLC